MLRSAWILTAAALVPQEPAQLGSHLVRPLFLDEAPPEARALRSIQIGYAEAEEPRPGVTRGRAEAKELAEQVAAALRAGEPFGPLFERHADGPPAQTRGVLGSFPRGLLQPEFEGFLWAAELGRVSDPIASRGGFHVLQRIEQRVGCRHVLFRGKEPEQLEQALATAERLRAGADLLTLVEEELGAVRLTQAVYERSARDAFLKRAAFESAPGAVFGPLESTFGYHVGRRIPVDDVPPESWPVSWVRGRAILIAHAEVAGPRQLSERSPGEAQALVEELVTRLRSGEDMAELARTYDDDWTGRERAGDLGWLYRENPAMTRALDRLFLAQPGELLDPVPVPIGWILLKRER